MTKAATPGNSQSEKNSKELTNSFDSNQQKKLRSLNLFNTPLAVVVMLSPVYFSLIVVRESGANTGGDNKMVHNEKNRTIYSVV